MREFGKILALTLVMAGCGAPKSELTFIPVKGTVTLDGQPVAQVVVSAIPTGTTMGRGGMGHTNAKGEFTLIHGRGEPGLPEGEYRAVVSLRKNPDGSVPPPNDPTPPIESPAVESLPPRYSDPVQSELKFSVSAGGPDVELKLVGGK